MGNGVHGSLYFISTSAATAATNASVTLNGTRTLNSSTGTGIAGIVGNPPSTSGYLAFIRTTDFLNAAWETSGTVTLTIYTNTADASFDLSGWVFCADSGNVILQEGTECTPQTLSSAGPFTFTLTIPSWTCTQSCSNRFGIILRYHNTSTHGGSKNQYIDCGSTNNSDAHSIGIGAGDDTCINVLQQTSFRSRNDDGSETTATWRQTTNTNDSGDVTSDLKIRVRNLITNIGNTGGNRANTIVPSYKYRLNGGSWSSIPFAGSTQPLLTTSSTHFSNQDNTTQQIGSGTFESTNQGMSSGGGGQWVSPSITWDYNDEVEVEIVLLLQAAGLSDGDYLELKLDDSYSSNLFGLLIETVPVTKFASPSNIWKFTVANVGGGTTPVIVMNCII